MNKHESKQARWLLDGLEARLIAEYEHTQLPIGTTLEKIINEYEGIRLSPGIRLDRSFALVAIIVASIAISLLAIIYTTRQVSVYYWFLITGVLMWIYWYLPRVNKRCTQDAQALIDCKARLEAFSLTISKLNPTGITVRTYNEAKIRNQLVMLAVRVLDAEMKFDKLRLLPERRTFDVLHHGNFLEKSEEEFAKALETANNVFGLNLKRADLFKDAEEHIFPQKVG